MEPQIAPSRPEQALKEIARCLRESPDTSGGVQLRQLLWSLYNQHHLVNLWTLVTRLDSQLSALAYDVLGAALVGHLQETDLHRALLAAGEMPRWNEIVPTDQALQRLEEAQGILEGLIRSLPPCRAHTDLVSLLKHLAEVRQQWSAEEQGLS